MKLNSDQGATKLSASLSLITERLMNQYEQQELDLTVLRPLLPNVNIQGFIGKQNPIQDLLALQKIKFNEASFTAATSPAQGLSVNMAMHKFQQDTLMVDTLRIESFEDTSGLKLKGEVKLNRTRWRKAYNGILDGHIRKNEVNALVHVTDGDGKVGLHLGTEARLEKEGFITNIQGRGCYVLGEGSELLKEHMLREMERNLSDALKAAKIAGLDISEVHQALDLMNEEKQNE